MKKKGRKMKLKIEGGGMKNEGKKQKKRVGKKQNGGEKKENK